MLVEDLRSEHHKDVDPPGVWEDVIRELQGGLTADAPASPLAKIGGALNLSRSARDDEAALRVDEYAQVLKTFFSRAGDGEFCFALYGHWGRGKTFLMQRLAKALGAKDTNYQTVFFSAWKYPRTPEVWVHLYETLADAAGGGGGLDKLPRIIRAGIARNGPWALIGALATLALGLLPKGLFHTESPLWLLALGSALSFGGVTWLVLLLQGVRKTSKRLSKKFLSTPHHDDKLGLQATIGKDLRALLIGWMPKDHFQFGLAGVAYLAISGVLTWSAWAWFGQSAPAQTPYYWPQITATGCVAVLCLCLLDWVINGGAPPERVLLVVDDLDRCDLRQLLSVIESIKLQVEDREISRRVQVAMLVEEDILKSAILEKYRSLRAPGESRPSEGWFSDARLFYENGEKLFNAHLRLPPLGESELLDIVKKIVGREREYATALKRQETQTEIERLNRRIDSGKDWDFWERTSPEDPGGREYSLSAGEIAADVTQREALKQQLALAQPIPPAPAPVEPAVKFEQSEYIFEANEEAALQAAVPLLQKSAAGRSLGPRALRAFIFRYQLARLLLSQLNVPWTPEQLTKELVKASTGPSALTNDPIARVVLQIS
ncbi:MAG TPA: P-loop NTPase fold protein [Opitutales bacterium]|nr:P-loop NTPase fold protein [Opitutales bacterium]